MTNSKNSPWRSEALLREKYVGEGLSSRDLAELWGCSKSTILNWLDKHGIDKDNGHMTHSMWQDKETLEYLYLEKGYTAPEIGELLGCGDNTADKWLKKLDVSRRYQNKEWLYENFVEQEKSITEMADMACCTLQTVSRWLHKHDILPKHGDASYADEKPWQDKETLVELYHGEKLSAARVAEKLGCSEQTVRHWLIQHDIDRRSCGYRTIKTYKSIQHRYPTIQSGDGHTVLVHRFLAYACGKMSFEELCDSNMIVHHRTNIPWDNRPENYEVMDRSEHMKIHASKDYYPEVI